MQVLIYAAIVKKDLNKVSNKQYLHSIDYNNSTNSKNSINSNN